MARKTLEDFDGDYQAYAQMTMELILLQMKREIFSHQQMVTGQKVMAIIMFMTLDQLEIPNLQNHVEENGLIGG